MPCAQVNGGAVTTSLRSNHSRGSTQERGGGGTEGADSRGGHSSLPDPAVSAVAPSKGLPSLTEILALAKNSAIVADTGVRRHSCSDELQAASNSGLTEAGLSFPVHQPHEPPASAEFGFRRAPFRNGPQAGSPSQAAWQFSGSVPAPLSIQLEHELSLRLPLHAEQTDDNGSARGVPAVANPDGSFPAASVADGARRSMEHSGGDAIAQLGSAAAELKLGACGPTAGWGPRPLPSHVPTSASRGTLSSGSAGDDGRSDGTVAHDGEAHSNGGARGSRFPQGSQQVRLVGFRV